MITRHARTARILLASSFALTLSLAARSLAAPEPSQAAAAPGPQSRPAEAEREAGRPRGAGRGRAGAPGQARGNRQQKGFERGTQRERREGEREKRSQGLRRMMTSMGFGDRALQDEVLRYIAVEVRERGQVRRKAQEMYNALRDPARTDDEVREMLRQYQAVVEADRARRRLAENALDERIHFRANPRLEAMLTLFGVIGDAPSALPVGR